MAYEEEMSRPSSMQTTTVRVVAPMALPEGFVFDAMIGGQKHSVKVPKGGVEQGQEFPISIPIEKQEKIKSSATSRKQRTMRVMAPMALPEGYRFEAMIKGKPHMVTVPKGGVQQGEAFEIPYTDSSDGDTHRESVATARSKASKRSTTSSQKTTIPKTLRVVAPSDLPGGFLFDILLGDQNYTVTVPENGVAEGEEFEIPHPLYEPAAAARTVPKKSVESFSMDRPAPKAESTKQGKVIRLVAPKDLPEDYSLDVTIEGKNYTIAVPKGGVCAGEEFDIPHPGTRDSLKESGSNDTDDDTASKIPHRERDSLGAPFGRWRYPLCACCDVVTQATFWMALCCTPVFIAQLLTRLKLNWKGQKDTPEEVSLSYNKIVLTFIVVVAFGNLPVVGFFIIFLYIVGLLLWTGRNLRKSIRERYNIPPSLPGPIDDCCCMLVCCCCSGIQMSRQTHNDKEYPGSCCTPTGLDLDAPEMV